MFLDRFIMDKLVELGDIFLESFDAVYPNLPIFLLVPCKISSVKKIIAIRTYSAQRTTYAEPASDIENSRRIYLDYLFQDPAYLQVGAKGH